MVEEVKKKEEKNKETKVKKTSRSKSGSKKTIKKTDTKTAIKKENEKLKTELNELKDKYLRVIAEFDNYKKRTERDIGNIIENANKEFCQSLLPVIDDLERFLNSESETKKKSYSSLKKGVKLIYQKLITGLKSQGVVPIDAIGKTFNPEFHEAFMQVEEKDKPSNSVVKEAEKGYLLKDKVIRYSKVVVNK